MNSKLRDIFIRELEGIMISERDINFASHRINDEIESQFPGKYRIEFNYFRLAALEFHLLLYSN